MTTFRNVTARVINWARSQTSSINDMPAYVIYINGWPGVGKLTVARALQLLIPDSQILHNHELIDPVEKRYPRGHGLYQQKRSAYRQERLKPIMTDPALKNTVFIFTDSQTEHNDCMGDYTDLALGEEGRRFYSVILHCEQGEMSGDCSWRGVVVVVVRVMGS